MYVLIIYILIFTFILYKLDKKNRYNELQLKLRKKYLELQKYHLLKNQYLENIKKQKEADNEPPELKKLNQLLLEFERERTWDNIIAIGDIYKKGAYPRFKNNNNMAIECYKIAAMCPEGKIAGLAQVKYIEAVSCEQINEIDNIGENFPIYFGKEACKIALDVINSTPYNSFSKPTHHTFKLPTNTIQPYQTTHLINTTNTTPYANFTRITQQRNPYDHTYKNDAQNVHDHGVSNILKSNINILKSNINILKSNIPQNVDDSKGNNGNKGNNDIDNKDDNKLINNIMDSISSHVELPEKIKGNALLMITNLNDENIHSTYNITEIDALKMVWNKIESQENNEQKNNMIEILAKQLDSGIESGHNVCSSGKIARIIGTLDGIDDTMNTSRPMWIIRDEISNIAGKIMNSHSNNPKKEFENTIKHEYIDKLNLDPKIINGIINEFVEHL
jgi:hypothetical protein